MPDYPSVAVLTEDAATALEIPEDRLDGALKVSGRARYVNDVHLPGMLWADFLMSPHPHARIVSIDTTAALAVPGIHAVLTGRDIGLKLFGRALYDWPVLAYDRVRFVGERVAAVAGETRDAVDAAINLIQVEWEELPAVFDAEEAVRPDAPILHPEAAQYHNSAGRRVVPPHLNMQGYSSARKGDEEIERLFANAHLVVEDVYFGPRQHQGYIEPHGCVLWFDDEGLLQVVSTNKTPFSLRDQLGRVLDVPSERIVVDSQFIGGDFGGKGLSIEEFPCAFLARATGRPIKAVMTYTDELSGGDPQHAAKYRLRTAINREGRIIAHESHAYQNGGAYGGGRPNAQQSAQGGLGCLDVYNIPNARCESFMAYTNLVPSGNMRAPGAFHRGHAGEVHIDHIAREAGLDPLEFRLRNCLREGDTTITGGHVERPRAVEVLETLKRETNWVPRSELRVPSSAGLTRNSEPATRNPLRGRGIALRDRHVGAGKTEILFRLQPNATVEALFGTPDQGGGSHTVLQRVAAATLSVEPRRIRVRYGTTGESLYDAGSGGSRTTTMVGRAALDGARIMKDTLEDLAAEVMGWPAGQVRIEHDEFVVGDRSSERAPFEGVAEKIAAGPPVEVIGSFDPAEPHPENTGDANYYAYMAEVEVDPETGRVTPTEIVVVVDVGTVINPVAHQGQLDGGFIYGLGQAMTEELPHEDGVITTQSLGEYKLPTQMDTPRFRTVLLDRDAGPGAYGAKAAGEVTNTAVGGAIANAIYDATGVRIMASPITSERVLEALRAAHDGG
jgi:CO/xanthine dehydrogenase Mo-binding subunit